MSNESLSGLEKAKYCPHCGKKLEYEGTPCPSCGKQITDVQTGAVKRPLSLTIIAAIWFIAGLNNFLNPISTLAVISTAYWAYLKFGLGAIYIGTAIGLLTGKRWSYNLAFVAAGLGVILGTVSIISNLQMFRINFNLVPFIWAVIVWYYLNGPTAKMYLGITKEIPPENGSMYCPQCGTENDKGRTHCSNCDALLVLEKMDSKTLERGILGIRNWKIVASVLVVAAAISAGVGYYLMEEHLELTDIVFCTSEPAHRSYDQKPDAAYICGETVWMYLECYDFQYVEEVNTYVCSFYVTLEVFDSRGSCIGKIEQPIEASEKVKPPYAWFNFWIETDGLEEGEYSVRITVKDESSGKDGTTTGSFTVTKK